MKKLLGDSLYKLNGLNNKLIPHNVIDLLMLDIIKTNILNKNGTLHLVLWLLMGPPFSCNIRNLSWHGYFNNNMIPKHYNSFLIYILQQVIITINENKLLSDKSIRPFQTTLDNDIFKKW